MWFVTSSKLQTIVNCESWSPAWFVILDTRISTLQTPSFRSFNWRECRAVKKPRFNPCDSIDLAYLGCNRVASTMARGPKKMRKSRTSSHTLRVYPTSQTNPAKQIWIFFVCGDLFGIYQQLMNKTSPQFWGYQNFVDKSLPQLTGTPFRINPNTFKWRLTDSTFLIWSFFQWAVFWGEKSWISKFRNSQS